MKRKLITLSVMLLTFFTLTGFCQAQDFVKKFSLKLTGGYGTMAVGDFNTYIDTQEILLSDFATVLGLTKEGKLEELNMGIDLEGEFIMNLNENFGIGIGVGHIQRSKDNKISLEQELFGKVTYSIEPKFIAIPVNLSVYYFYPVTPSMNIFFNGGVGYYFGKVTSTSRQDLELIGEPSEWMESKGEFKDQGLGFHGGIGFEFNVSSNIGFFIEGKGRYCKLKSWEGDETTTSSDRITEKSSGTLLIFEVLEPDLGKWVSIITLSEKKPSGPDIRNVREFEGDLSGISLRAGIRIKF